MAMAERRPKMWIYYPPGWTPADGLKGVSIGSVGPDSQRYFSELLVPDQLRKADRPEDSLATSLRARARIT